MPSDKCYLWDRWGSGSWYDISAWASIYPVAETPQAEGQPQAGALLVNTFAANTYAALPVQLIGGQEILYYRQDAFGAGLHDYYLAGRIVQIDGAPKPGGIANVVTVEGFERELNTQITAVSFDESTYPLDSDRIRWLCESSGVLQGTWDAHTYVMGGYVNYVGTGVRTFTRRSIWDILRTLSQEPANVGWAKGWRRWHVTGAWSNPAAPGTGTLVRVLHYYESLTGPQYAVPLTDRQDRAATLVRDSFNRTDNPLALGAAETGQNWLETFGQWQIVGNQAALILDSAGHENLATFDAGAADGELYVTFAVKGSQQRLAFRTVQAGADYSGWLLENNGGTQYQLYKRTGGNNNLVATYAVTPANGDRIGVKLAGSSITPVINGVAKTPVTDSMNSTATRHGLACLNSATALRWDDLLMTGKGVQYYDWQHTKDYTGLINVVAINGPQSDPVPVSWDSAATVNASAGAGRLQKTDVADWQASHGYTVGDRARPKANPNGRHYRVTTGGTSGATEPAAWTLTEGGTVTDGSVVWTCDTWDSGALSSDEFLDDGGYVSTTIEETLLASDSFNRPDGPLGTTEDGKAWAGTGAWAIASSACKPGSAGWAIVDSGIGSSVIVQGRFAVAVTGMRLVFRYLDSNNLWFLERHATDIGLYSRAAGVDTLRLTIASTTIVNGDVVKIAAADDVIRVYLNGVFKNSISGAAGQWLMGASKHGFGVSLAAYPTAVFDDLRVWQSYTTKVFGMGFGNTGTGYADVDFGIRIDAAQTAQAIEAGTLVGGSVAANVGDRFKVDVRRRAQGGGNPAAFVSYYRMASGSGQWALMYESATHPAISEATPLRVDTALYHVGAVLSSVELRRYTYAVYADAASVAKYGRWWAKDTLNDDTLNTAEARQARADSIFARYAGPRDTLQATTLTPFQAGLRVPVSNTRLGWDGVVRIISRVDVKHTSAQTRAYLLTLGDAPVEYGDDEPLGFLMGAPDRDVTAPLEPQGLTDAGGQRDGAYSVAERFTYAAPAGDEQYIDVAMSPADNPNQRDIRAYPARAGEFIWPGLSPGRLYRVQARYRDFNNNASPWGAVVEFTTQGIVSVPGLIWATPTVTAQGVDSAGMAWVTLAWIAFDPSIPVALISCTVCRHGLPGPYCLAGFDAPAGQLAITIRGLVPGLAYDIVAQSIDTYGNAGGNSAAVTVTLGAPPVDAQGYSSGTLDSLNPLAADPSEALGWRIVSAPAGTTLIRSQAFTRRGEWSLKLACGPTGGDIIIEQARVPTTPGEYYGSWAAFYALQSGGSFEDRAQWYDSAGAAAGTPQTNTQYANPLPVGAWAVLRAGPIVALSTPTYSYNAQSMGRNFRWVSAPANGVLYLAPPDWQESADTNELYPRLGLTPLQFYDDTALGTAIAEIRNNAGPIKVSALDNRDLRLTGAAVYLDHGGGTAGLGTGAGFPASPATGQAWYHPTTGQLAYYDGARWLGPETALDFRTYPGGLEEYKAISGALEDSYAALRGDYALYVMRWSLYAYVNGTNNSTNRWDILLRSFQPIAGFVNLATAASHVITGSSAWPGSAYQITSFTNQPGATVPMLQIYVTPTGSPGLLRFASTVWVRPVYPAGL